jgi:hypothetical protein
MKARCITAGARTRKGPRIRGPDAGTEQLHADQFPQIEHPVIRPRWIERGIESLAEADPESLDDG